MTRATNGEGDGAQDARQTAAVGFSDDPGPAAADLPDGRIDGEDRPGQDGHLDGTGATPGRPGHRWPRRILEWVAVLAVAAGLAVVLRSYVFEVYSVPSPSMVPTIRPGDRILVVKAFFNAADLKPGAIVVFRRPPKDKPGVCAPPEVNDLVKRIVGLPGQTISSRGNTVLVNGKPLPQPYLAPGTPLGRPISPPVHVPKGQYFVLGDNRAVSCDSRYWGTIKGSSIVGQVVAVIWRNGHPWLHTF